MTTTPEYDKAWLNGYDAGWKARGEYIRDYQEANSNTSLGLVFMIFGIGMCLAVITIAVITPAAALNVTNFFILIGIFGVISVAGYFINRVETVSAAKRKAAFLDKWGNK